MSGHKRTTIRTNLQNLKEFSQAEMSLRFIEAGIDQLNRRMDNHTKRVRNQQTKRDQAENKFWRENLSLINENIGQLETNLQAAIDSQHDGMVNTMHQIADSWGEQYQHNISDLHEHYHANLENLKTWQQAKIQPMLDDVAGMIEYRANKEVYFQQLLTAVEESQYLIEQEPEVELVFPGIGRNSHDLIHQAFEDGQAGFLDAAVSSLHTIYRDLENIRLDYNEFRKQYDEYIRIAVLELDKLEREVLLNLQVPGMDLEGRVLSTIIVVDEWVEGAMSRLHQKVQYARHKLSDPISPGKLAELEQFIYRKIPGWRKKVTDLVTRARAEVINSQLRMNIANLALKALTTQGYQVELATYDEADMRRDYCVQVVDIEGSRVVIKVKSNPDQPQTMGLELFASDQKKRTQHEITQRAAELERSLQRAGLSVGTFEPVLDQSVRVANHRKKPRLEQKLQQDIQVENER